MMDSIDEAGLELSSTLIKSEDLEESIERKNGHGMSREEELILFNIKEDEEGGERQSVEGKRENGVKDEAGDEMEQTSKTARGLEKRASNCKTPEEEVSSFLVTSCLLKRPRVPSPGSPVTSSSKGNAGTAACEEDTGRRQRRQQSRMGDTDDTRTRVSDTPDVTSPRRKKPKRLQKYRTEWEKENVWVEKVHDNVYKAYCTVCWRAFSVGHGGLFDLKQHASSGGHIRNMRDKDSKTRGTLDQFVVHQTTPEADMVTAAEIAHIYHTVKHGLSYNSADCALKLALQTLNDSNIAKKMSCGRTKAEAVVTHVLSPKAIEEVIKYLKRGGNPLPFSLHTDASNKGNRKMFPLAVQFFTPENGVVKKVIDFFENPDESAEGIVKTIQSSLENMGLSLDHVSAFSADNANVSYGIHNSVFTKLREANSEILRGNCHAHIVHNTVKKALDKLSVDVENIVLKIYSFFSTSARRSESLKEFCEFCDVEFHEILLHVATRWLSLNPAITRLLQNWVPLKSYLLSIGEECPGRLKTLLRLTEDAAGVEEEADIVEVYLIFCNHIMSLIEEVVKKLEKNVTTSVDLYSIMDSFLRRLIQRRDDAFYGYLTRQKLKRLSPSDADLARQEFTAFLNTAISYVQKWFDFSEENWLFHLQPLSLASGKISFDDMEKITERLRLVGRLNISMDELYDECVTANSLLERLTALPQEKGKWQSKGTAERWMLVLQAAHLPNIQALVSFVLSIPSSTGFVERISSFMKNRWTDVRNKCSLELIRSELIVTLNYEMPCSEFYSVALKDKQLLAAARGQKKYKWKK